MIRIYTFTIEPPARTDLVTAGELMTKQLDRMAATNPDLVESDLELTEDNKFILTITFQARDAWYIHRKIKFPLVAALRKANLKMEHVRSTQISVPVSGRDRPTPRVPPLY